ncbi:phosphatase PAP2 family protein [Roseospira visakhapatnamensis]|uniref:Lipid A 4'-phosphatase n=1 Tax=Roseospira visakhapatnamensis TaxID=390880 RepID=A0A7W6RAQ0_9PROT|nr:phosphatase PAP2 family protein [Roseospira visakhapatnamensis]MBB4265012.1 lipid A 4'-phosphatase [Roseospira visakhapatnamensis]
MTTGRPAAWSGIWGYRVLLALVLVLVAFPQIDLAVSGVFYDPEQDRFMREGPLLNLLRKGVPPILYGVVLFLVLQWLGGRVTGAGTPHALNGRRVAFVLTSLALGPGLIVNGVFKEWWGRARPSDILAFGGEARFTPPWMMTDQCASNCSFVAGHAALGFWTVALALLAPPAWRPWAVAGALGFGALMSGARVVVGGHFLSDVLFAGVVVVTVTLWLHRVMVDGPERATRADPATVSRDTDESSDPSATGP